MGSLGLRVRNGDRDIFVTLGHAFRGFYRSRSRRVVSREKERGSSPGRLGGDDGNAVCNDREIGSFRVDDLLFCQCFMVRKIRR